MRAFLQLLRFLVTLRAIISRMQRLDIRRRGGGAHLPDPSKDYYTDLQHQAEERHRQKRSQREGERRPEQQLADRGTWMWGGEQGSSEVSGNVVRNIESTSPVVKRA